MNDRSACACRNCPCTSSTSVANRPCPSCSAGAHRPSEEIQRHLRAGLDRWIEIMPTTLGSSGLSDAQLRQSAEAWAAWHRRSHCPLAAPAAAT